ncbi:MAG: hypothetical protein PF569_02945 [Candidatus Woesearchaeota archaeon]|jgi:hypothetical protein|nr:hypothetical protein [Candidatus Woesearchaeota archaeon]
MKPNLNKNKLLWGGHDFLSFSELDYYSKKINMKIEQYKTFSNMFFFRIRRHELRSKLEDLISLIPIIRNYQQMLFIVIKKNKKMFK